MADRGIESERTAREMDEHENDCGFSRDGARVDGKY